MATKSVYEEMMENLAKPVTADAYKAAGNIVGNKGMYNDAKYTNKTGNHQQYADAAQASYQTLYDAGFGDLADQLKGSNYTQAMEIYNRLVNPTTTSGASQISQETLNRLLGTDSGSKVDIGQATTQSEELMKTLNKYLHPNEQEQSALAQSQANLQNIVNTYLGNNAQTQNQTQDLLNAYHKFVGDQSNRYQDHYDWQKTYDPLSSQMGQSVMSYYNQFGDKAAGNATAQGAANNSGNIDSYAAANANRQQLAYTNAGMNAVNQQYNSQMQNMLGTLQSLGVDVNTALQNAGNVVGNSQNYNLGILGNYTTGDTNLQNVMGNTQMSRNQDIASVVNRLLGLNETNSNNASIDYGNQLNAATGAYNTAAGADTTRYGQETQARTDIYGYDTQKNIAAANNEAALNQLNAQLASNERLSMAELQNALQRANISAGVSYAELANAYKIASEKNTSNEKITEAELANALAIVREQNKGKVDVAKIENSSSTATGDNDYNYQDVLTAFNEMKNAVSRGQGGSALSDTYVNDEAWNKLMRGADKETQDIIKSVRKIWEDEGGALGSSSGRTIIN